MESHNNETGDFEYQRVFTALDEVKLASLKPFFKDHCLQDDALYLMKSEEELRNILVKDLKVPYGHSFKFSRHWFHKYHKSEELGNKLQAASDTVPLPEVEPLTNLATARNIRANRESCDNPLNSSQNGNSTSTKASSSSTQINVESSDLLTGQREAENCEGKPGKEREHAVNLSVELPTIAPKDRVYDVEATSNSSCGNQQKAQKLFSESKTLADIDNMNDTELGQITVKERLTGKLELQEEANMNRNVDSHFKLGQPSMQMWGRLQSVDREELPIGSELTDSKTTTQKCHSECTDHEGHASTHDIREEDFHSKMFADENVIDAKRLLDVENLKHGSDNQKDDCTNIAIREKGEETVIRNSLTTSLNKTETATDHREEPTNENDPIDYDLDVETTKTTSGMGSKDYSVDETKLSEEAELEQFVIPAEVLEEDAVSTSTEPITLQEKSANVSVAQIENEISSARGDCNPTADQKSFEVSEQSHGKDNLTDTDINHLHEVVPQVVSKCMGSNDYSVDETKVSEEAKLEQFVIPAEVLEEDAVSTSTEPITLQEKSANVSLAQIENEISSARGDCNPTADQKSFEVSEQSHVKDNLTDTDINHLQEVVPQVVSKCSPRPQGGKGREFTYEKGFVLDTEENREVEFKSLKGTQSSLLPWKIMEKAKKFICACLNADSKGIIYFGVGDCQEQSSKFKRGEILGLDVEGAIDDIMKAFQCVLDDHIHSDEGPLQKAGEQKCVNLEFVPVVSEGSSTSLYVIEIEVNRDWKFCKDKIYYSKSWTEKRGIKTEETHSTKKALSDFYKVFNKFDDVAVRTSGASQSMQQYDVKRQVKEPLRVKYKDWKRKRKSGVYELSADPLLEDSDVIKYSAMVKNRMKNINHKDFGYVLIANKMPPQYRGTPRLAFLQNIPWLAVFDLFDPASKEDGLYYVCNETTDTTRAKLRSLDDFKNMSSDGIPGQTDFSLPTRGTTWILSNEEVQKGDWIKNSRDSFYRGLSAYKHCCPSGRILCFFLGLDESGIQEMVDMMDCCFSILGNSASNWVTIMSENKRLGEAFIKAAKHQLQRELTACSIIGIRWEFLEEIVRDMVGLPKFEEREATTELPYFTGNFRPVLNKIINSWDDLEVYSPNPRPASSLEDIEKERNNFYKGGQASQTNLFHNHCIQRTLEEETTKKIDQLLRELSKPGMEVSPYVQTITVPYEPGSGATTLCRTILWKKRKDVRCAIVKAITPATDYQVEQLHRILYDEKNLQFALPCLILVDNFPEIEIRRLTEKIMKRQMKCVILSTFSIAKLSRPIPDSADMTPLRQLDANEMTLVKDILINITSDSRRRREAEEVLDRERRFIWFGLELFGRDYNKIEERLQDHIQSTLELMEDSQKIHEMVLNFCCFLHYYSDGRAILPHAVVSDILYEASKEQEQDCALTEHVHRIFGGLLLEGFNDTNGYHGWRPAHSLVSEVVKSQMSTEETAVRLLEVINKGKAHANKFLKDQVLKVFLDRKRISDPVLMEEQKNDAEGNESDFEDEVFGFYEVKTRYSPFIVDILEGDFGRQKALGLLITICQKTSETEEKAYAWQQLARFMGYEMAANEMDQANDQHRRLYVTMNSQQDVKVSIPETGIEAAHIAVDIAIHLQPNYSHHYVIKGNLYLLQLRNFKPEERPIPLDSYSMTDVIEFCRKALEFYDKALSTMHVLNHYSMIGKIQAIVSLLKIVKGLPLFLSDREGFTRYLKRAEVPEEIESVLKPEENNFVQSLSITALGLLNELFGDVKFRQMTTYDNKQIRGLSNAKIRAGKLRRTFYEVTGFDRSELKHSLRKVPMPSSPVSDPVYYQQVVQDILFAKDETTYSSWAKLDDEEVSYIYRLLKGLCHRGYGNHDDMLICCKACLRLKDRPPVEELDGIVSKWVAKYPNSEWAHLFRYMIHFPTPNGSLAVFSPSAMDSIKKCGQIVREKTGRSVLRFRKSAAEYCLGKGRGLYAFVSMQSLENKGGTKTDFWRSDKVSEKLERVQGQKDANFNGVITYKGIQVRFDNTRYPNQSKDDLWFYVGFSVSGPYAFDPVDKDTYKTMRSKSDENVLYQFPASPPLVGAVAEDSMHTSLPKKGGKGPGLNDDTSEGEMSESALAKGGISYAHSDLVPATQLATNPTNPSTPQFSYKLPSGSQGVKSPLVSSSSGNVLPTSGITSGKCDDCHHIDQNKSSKQISYSSAVQLGGGKVECKKIANTSSSEMSYPISVKSCKWKPIEGRQRRQRRLFQPLYVDESGKLHHGAWVLGAEKSRECNVHTKLGKDTGTLERCSFAHSWRGDTLQFVCIKCTIKKKKHCKERYLHKADIWNLGPYLNEDGAVWKDITT
ncbi:sterile alpha motif domain-containing protein 9-like isoform X3 [Montipora capricornis]|uniref:sterile alpha motif domain-containing protein 9-like isoform X2 n=1 Tax=Montipora capricornis TaxID=246305 RepID=UPI0035F1EB2A